MRTTADLKAHLTIHFQKEGLGSVNSKPNIFLMGPPNVGKCSILTRHGESSSDPHPKFWDYGIHQNEGSILLCEEEGHWEEMHRSCIMWCTQSNIEYIEVCAINEAFDKCMSIDGDLQGVDHIRSALTTHMWHGMTMKSQSKLNNIPLQRKKEGFSYDDFDYDIAHELLSTGPANMWDGMEDRWVTVNSCEQVEIPVVGKVECKNDTESEHGHVGIQELQEASSSWQQMIWHLKTLCQPYKMRIKYKCLAYVSQGGPPEVMVSHVRLQPAEEQ